MDSYHAAIHENLRLLIQIFPNLDMESRLQEGMFRKPNTRGMQSVFYSLMTILNPEYCKQHVPWPISFQSDNFKFRTSVVNFIKTECPDFEAPQLLPSLLNKAEGEKYVRLLFDFVTYVTKTIIKRKNFAVLNLPSTTIDESESVLIFNAATATVLKKIQTERQSSKQHKDMIENSSRFINESDSEKKKLLKDIRHKREKLHNELKHMLSYTNINEKNIIELALLDYQNEARELRRNHSIVQTDVNRVLTKIEHLLRLIDLQRNRGGVLISDEYLRSVITNDLASRTGVPLSTILSTVFVNSDNGPLINLKEFVHYSHLLLKSWQRKFLDSQVPNQNYVVHHEADDILNNATKEVEKLEELSKALDRIICDTKQTIPALESRCQKDTMCIDKDLVESMRVMISMRNYHPKISNQFTEKSILSDMSKVHESNEDIVARLQKMMKELPAHP